MTTMNRMGYIKQRVTGRNKKFFPPDSVTVTREKMAAQKAKIGQLPIAKYRQPLRGIQNLEQRQPQASKPKLERRRAIDHDVSMTDADEVVDISDEGSHVDDDDDDVILPAITIPHQERPPLQRVPSKTNRRASLNDYTLLVTDSESMLKAKKARKNGFDVQAPISAVILDEPVDLNDIGVGIQTMLRKQADIEDIDSHDDVFMCSEYIQDIILYLQSKEDMHSISPEYLETSGDISPKMRAILIDWLIQVQVHLSLLGDTLHMAVSIIDRFLNKADVALSKFQLLGITSLFVAAKYNERFAPEVDTLVHLTDNTYTYQQVIQMELVVLHNLEFDLSFPGPYIFLERYLLAAKSLDSKVKQLALYLIDLSITDAKCIQFRKSEIVAAALYLSLSIHDERHGKKHAHVWTPTLAFYSMYSERQLYPCSKRLAFDLKKVYSENNSLMAAKSKYSHAAFDSIATLAFLPISNIVDSLTRDNRN